MQGPECRSSSDGPDWSQLPSELLARIFKLQTQNDRLRAESCCRSWLQVLRSPQGSAVWGSMTIELDELRSRLLRNGAVKFESQLYLPVCQWLKVHASGLESLVLTTTDFDIDDVDDQDRMVKEITQGCAMLVASFARLSAQLHVDLRYKPLIWHV
ncbi:hypothetical protein WJX73_008760 [Symbiochloris irregularis]|uniref:F-box domain-containing protein n=1 Tax=Symbiochloris irregularis TaxID=706552 RepID=A0AAW1PZB9_9CHLO